MEQIYQSRQLALAQAALSRQLNTAVVTSPTALRYLTGVSLPAGERLSALILSRGKAFFLLPLMEAARIPEDSGLIPLPYCSEKEMAGHLSAVLSGPMGVEKDHLSLMWAELFCRCGQGGLKDMQDISPLLNRMRCRKDSAEIAALAEACRRTDNILARWAERVSPGLTQQQLRRILDDISLEEGVTSSCPGILIAIGANSALPHGDDQPLTLQPGDPLYIDCGARWDGYYCDITRTFFLGQPEPEAAEVYRIVLAAHEAAIAAVRPGVPLRDVDLAARQVIEQAGYGAFFTHRTGHGLGLAVHEFPGVGADSQQLAEPGMVFTIEPGIYLPGRWGVRIEDDIVVEEDGCRVLNRFPKSLEQMILPL